MLPYLNGMTIDQAVDVVLSDPGIAEASPSRDDIARTAAAFGGDAMAATVFLRKYALRSDGKIVEYTLLDAAARWAKAMAEQDRRFSPACALEENDYLKLYDYFLPAGRQMLGLGNFASPNLTLSNCYATSIEDDSLDGIFSTALGIAKTFAWGGGQGVDLSTLRPAGARVSNSAGQSTGAVSFAGFYADVSALIGQHGRRGALLLAMRDSHPDIEAFIALKRDPTMANAANMSVKVSDELMRAVEADGEFELWFDSKHERIRQPVRARELWRQIVNSAHASGEPGVLFWDAAVRASPTECYPGRGIVCCNPCAEQPLGDGDACVLGSLLLSKFVSCPFTAQARFDFELFREMTRLAVRHLDNVVELGADRHPLDKQRESARALRRIGLSVTGLADMLAMMGLRYGSSESLELVGQVMAQKCSAEYAASVGLAKERGSFGLFNYYKHYGRGFCLGLPDGVKAQATVYGQRNAAISTVSPSGSLSVIAQSSSGCEPVFARSYSRFTSLGAERREFRVTHHALLHPGAKPELFPEAHEVDYDERLAMQDTLQRYTDSAVSSTINLPSSASVEDVDGIYRKAWALGLKGVTVYRDGCREGILVKSVPEVASGELDTKRYKFIAEGGDKFYIHVGREDGSPVELFITNYKSTESDRLVKLANALRRVMDGRVESDRLEKQGERSRSTLDRITRYVSLALKSGLLDDVLTVLYDHGTAGTLAARLYGILGGILAACRSCGSADLAHEGGCVTCLNCGDSQCGG